MKYHFITLISLFILSLQLSGQNKNTIINIETSMGDIEILLYDNTPLHRDNMIKLVKSGFYDDLLFHRVISNFMIQGGDPHSKNAEKGQRLGTGGPGYTVPAEINETNFHKKGALAAARKGDRVNPEKASSGSQFYIVQGQEFTKEQLATMQSTGRFKPFTEEQINIYTTIGGTPHLDGAYTVFGEVIKGMEVIDSISAVNTDNNNRPIEDIKFSISIK